MLKRGISLTVVPNLFCPMRGELQVLPRAKDGLTFTEEKRRIDCVNFLINHDIPKENIRVEKTLIVLGQIGHKGRTSVRVDIAVYDVPVEKIIPLDQESQREHTLIVAEIKREHKDAESGKTYQLLPALRILPDIRALGIYWDDIEQRLYHKKIIQTILKIVESPIAYFPRLGYPIEKDILRYIDLVDSPDLVGLFRRLEDTLHSYIADKVARFQILMQLLLSKMYDEESHKKTNTKLDIQDFSTDDEHTLSDAEVLKEFNKLLNKALNIYQSYLPDRISTKFNIPGAALREISRYIAPVNLLNSAPDVIQNFYMYFAKQLYKWDLAQYFTPYEVVDFIVRIVNPQYGEIIKDPACGSADFLISAYRYLLKMDDSAGDRVWGADISKQAVQISVLNMLLNGDGKSNITEEDSLIEINTERDKYDIMLCNPPFGTRIVERRKEVLENFDLGKKKKNQQVGMLFTELCVKQVKKGGRVAIILPNGYLGNISSRYRELREWILNNTYVIAIIAFPRFTFKKSGADVSASVLILERRNDPLSSPSETEDYPIYVNFLESVGWEVGNSKARKIYKRDPSSGVLLLDGETNAPILDADFDIVERDLLNSAAPNRFPWLLYEKGSYSDGSGWSVSIRNVIEDEFITLDPKRLNRKYMTLKNKIEKYEYLTIGEICDIIPEGFSKIQSNNYRYVDLTHIHERSYEYSIKVGWDLPSRAKHLAQTGDIFLAKIWGSVNKWALIGYEAQYDPPIIFTNGCYRLKMKDGMEKYLPDLVFALSSEFYRVQMRALATGSDGLADIIESDLVEVSIPIIQNDSHRFALIKIIDTMKQVSSTIHNIGGELLEDEFSELKIKPRRSNFTQV